MGLRDFWKQLVGNASENGNPLQIPYIDLQRAFQLFVPQLYYLSENSDAGHMERIISETTLSLNAGSYFALKTKSHISKIGAFTNRLGGSVFFGEGATTNKAGEDKEFLYIFLCTLSHNGEKNALDTTGHFLFLGEFCSDRTNSLTVVPQLIVYKPPETSGTAINPSDEAGVLNALSIANQIFLSILRQTPVDEACFSVQERDVFSKVAKNRTLESLERDIRRFEQEEAPLLQPR